MGKVDINKSKFKDNDKPKYKISTRNKIVSKILKNTPKFPKEEIDVKDYLVFDEYNDLIEEFYNILKDNFPEEACNSFKKNIKDLNVKRIKRTLKQRLRERKQGFRVGGLYYGDTNEIEIIKDKKADDFYKKTVIFHELVHMASAKNKDYMGFFQMQQLDTDKYLISGRMLNEGYTELITEEYFVKDFAPGVYDHEVALAAGIERIIGKEVMQKYYFDADLKGLINEINKYEEDYDAIMFILVSMDQLQGIKDADQRELQAKLLRTMIGDIYERKIQKELEENIITEEEFARRKLLFVDRYIETGIYYSDETTIRETDNLMMINDNGIMEVITKDNICQTLIPDIEKRPKINIKKLDSEVENNKAA